MHTVARLGMGLGLLVALTATAAAGPVGTAFTYQGQLKQAGVAVTGTTDMIFTMWNAATGGSQVGPTLTFDGAGGNPAPIAVSGGLFTVPLDFGAGSFDGTERWLAIQVRYPSGAGAYSALTPRQKLNATPYAEYALNSPGSGLWTSDGSATYNTADNFVGINRSTRVTGNEYFGIQAPVTSSYGGMYIATDGANALPFYGYTTPNATCWTYLNGSTGTWFLYNGGNRVSVSTAGDVGIGIGTATPAARVDISSTTGDGLHASTTAAFSTGIYASGTSSGVEGVSGASNGYGVYGHNGTTGGEGVRGSTSASGAAGVAGYANFGTGVYGQTSNGYAIYGSAPGGPGWAGYFNGNVNVAGTLSKSGGSFKIDHPLDPANKYLYHSFVESPDMMNIYNGLVTTDAQGYATIAMPDWFEALNQDFRYQLTVVDDSENFVLAKVTQEIRDNAFVIRTSAPSTKVSWQVTGIRHDAWADAHRIPVEQNKPDAERGKFLHPELFGADASQNVAPDRPAFKDSEQG